MKKSDAALVTINKAMNIDPKNPLCKFHRASILFSMDKHKVWSSSSSPLILGRGRQLVQDLISSSKRKMRECIVCKATVLLSTSSQVYTNIGILHKWGLYDKNHITSFVLRCAIFAKKTLPVMLTAVAFFPADEAVSRVPNLSQLDVWYGKVLYSFSNLYVSNVF